jgi:hypothetical protein
MATALEDLKVLQTAEGIADAIWGQVVRWDERAKSNAFIRNQELRLSTNRSGATTERLC